MTEAKQRITKQYGQLFIDDKRYLGLDAYEVDNKSSIEILLVDQNNDRSTLVIPHKDVDAETLGLAREVFNNEKLVAAIKRYDTDGEIVRHWTGTLAHSAVQHPGRATVGSPHPEPKPEGKTQG